MTRSILKFAAVAVVLVAGFAAVPSAQAADTVGTMIYSPTPQMFKPFEMQMHLKPAAMKVIHADLQKMHTITCTLTGSSNGNDMAMLHCTPGS